MKATKTIEELIDKPRLDDDTVLLEITDEYIEVKGSGDCKLEISPGRYQYVDISDTKLNDSLLNNISTFRSTAVRCVFSKSQMTGLQLPEGNFKHVQFKNCRINLTNFRSSTFKNCVFEDCDLSEADFAGSEFTNVLIKNCQLENTEFSNCKNQRLEFESSSLSMMRGTAGLKGATISEANLIEIAAALARELEITVKY